MLTGERPVDSLRTPPAPGWQLRVTGPQITVGNKIYPTNSVLPDEVLMSANSGSLLRSLRIAWCPPGPPGPAPRELPAPTPTKGNPPVEIIIAGNGLDEVETLRLTYAYMIRKCDGNAALARDLIIGDKRGNDLYMRARARLIMIGRSSPAYLLWKPYGPG
jgi:hypothetical protein